MKKLKEEIQEIGEMKKASGIQHKAKNFAQSLGKSTKTVFNELGKAANQVFMGATTQDSKRFESIDEAIRGMPQ